MIVPFLKLSTQLCLPTAYMIQNIVSRLIQHICRCDTLNLSVREVLNSEFNFIRSIYLDLKEKSKKKHNTLTTFLLKIVEQSNQRECEREFFTFIVGSSGGTFWAE
jgi:hypothetical protein